eukprot:6175906-Pleurochrysis_carterae.AAC.1
MRRFEEECSRLVKSTCSAQQKGICRRKRERRSRGLYLPGNIASFISTSPSQQITPPPTQHTRSNALRACAPPSASMNMQNVLDATISGVTRHSCRYLKGTEHKEGNWAASVGQTASIKEHGVGGPR